MMHRVLRYIFYINIYITYIIYIEVYFEITSKSKALLEERKKLKKSKTCCSLTVCVLIFDIVQTHQALYNLGLCNKKLGIYEEALEGFFKLQSIVRNHSEVGIDNSDN